jgi:DNA-binding transcriptional LysR family regulator
LSPAAEFCLIPRVLPQFARRHADVRLDLHVLPDGGQVSALQSGTVQVGLLVPPVSHPAEFVLEPVVRETLAAAVPRGHVVARRPRLSPSVLASLPLVFFRRDVAPRFYDAAVAFFVRNGHPFEPMHETDSLHACIALAARGVGYTIVPAASRSTSDGVVYRPLGRTAPDIELAALYRRGDGAGVLPLFLATLRQLTGRRRRGPRRSGRRAGRSTAAAR